MGGARQTLVYVVWVAWVHNVFGWIEKNGRNQHFGVGETYFMNFGYDSLKFYL